MDKNFFLPPDSYTSFSAMDRRTQRYAKKTEILSTQYSIAEGINRFVVSSMSRT